MQETEEVRAAWLKKARETAKRRRMRETEEARAVWLETTRETARVKRENESQEARVVRQETARVKREKESQEAKVVWLKTARVKREKESQEARVVWLETARVKRGKDHERQGQPGYKKKKGKLQSNQKYVKPKDLLKMNNNGLSQVLSIHQLNSQVRKIGKSLNHSQKVLQE